MGSEGSRWGPTRQPLSEDHKKKLEELGPQLGSLFAEAGIECRGGMSETLSPKEIGRVVASVLETFQAQGRF